MGNLRRIRRANQPMIAMADAHVAVNGCQVFLGHTDPDKALISAKGFNKMLTTTIARAKRVNIGDMYNASFAMREKIETGESILN